MKILINIWIARILIDGTARLKIILTGVTQVFCLQKHENYAHSVQQTLVAYQILGCYMSLKIHLLLSHLDFFPDCFGDVSDEHGERFHREISVVRTRNPKKLNDSLMDDFGVICRRKVTACISAEREV